MKLTFNDKNGRIEGLFVNGRDIINTPHSLFELTLRKSDGDEIKLSSDLCSDTAFSENAGKLVFKYRFDELSVRTEIEIRDGSALFGIIIENNSGMYVERLRYPCINVKNDLSEGGRIFLPYCEGAVISKLSDTNDDKLYPGLINMQFMGYYNEDGGIYFATEDTGCTPKKMDCKNARGGIDMIIEPFVAVAPGDTYEKSDFSVIREFSGDWQDCCELYRNFTESSGFALPKRNDELENAPEWYENPPLVVIYPVRSIVGVDYFGPNEYYPYMNGRKYMRELQSQVESPVMALLINWEGSAPWCPPFIWPPYGGEEGLKAFVDAMHEDGNYVGLYASGINWTDQSVFCPEYDMTEYRKTHGIDEILCTKPTGELDEERCVRSVRSGYHMCPACEGTKDMTYEQIRGIASCKIDYLQYFDQNLGGASDLCYSKHHGHPPVHGSWAVSAMKDIYKGVQGILDQSGHPCYIGAESSPSDCFASELKTNDLRFPWAMANLPFTGIEEGISVPAFQFVFHEYTMNFMGNQCAFCREFYGDENAKSLNLRLAHSFVSGDMLTVVLKSGGEIHFNWGASWLDMGPDQVETKSFIKALSKMKSGLGKSFLQLGRMEKCPEIKCSTVTFRGEHREITYNSVFASKFSYGGQNAVFLVNHTDKEQDIFIPGEYITAFDGENQMPFPGNSLTLKPFEVMGLIEK